MKRWWILPLVTVLLFIGAAWADEPEMRISIDGGSVLPGRPAVVVLTAPADGTCSIRLLDAEGRQVSAVSLDRAVTEGYNSFYWNGTFQGLPAPEGTWRAVMEMDGRTAETSVTVGRMIPCVISPSLSESRIMTGKNVTLSCCATEAGELWISLLRDGAEAASFRFPVEQGDGDTVFPASVPPGQYQVELTLRRADGTASEPVSVFLEVADPETAFSPLGTIPETDRDYSLNGWTVPMDISDEEAVWQALTADVTVLYDGKNADLRRQLVVRKEPSWDSEGIGVVTILSQGVHVLERGKSGP